ncbi:hypothetical protein V2J09_007287, partial [Rumex salicifolius]
FCTLIIFAIPPNPHKVFCSCNIKPLHHSQNEAHSHEHSQIPHFLGFESKKMDPFFLHYHQQNSITQMNNNNHQESSHGNLPPGFRFHPTDEELITFYLLKKVLDSSFSGRAIAEVDLNKCEPWQLPEKAKMGEKEWYFFSLRDRKYPTGLRTNRATEAGYWKATGKDREIHSSKTCSLVGMKKTLVFYRGRAPKGEKSNWVMHEYRLEGKFAYHYLSRSSKDEWVISRVFQKTGLVTGSGSVSGNGVGKKGRTNRGIVSSHYADVSSPVSVTLPPLLDSSPYAATSASAMSAAGGDCYSESETAANRAAHVSCFSTAIPAVNNVSPLFPAGMQIDVGSHHLGPTPAAARLPPFPNLRSLQENLQLSNFLLSGGVAAPPGMHNDHLMGGWGGGVEDQEQKVAILDGGVGGGRTGLGLTELDCMWSF